MSTHYRIFIEVTGFKANLNKFMRDNKETLNDLYFEKDDDRTFIYGGYLDLRHGLTENDMWKTSQKYNVIITGEYASEDYEDYGKFVFTPIACKINPNPEDNTTSTILAYRLWEMTPQKIEA